MYQKKIVCTLLKMPANKFYLLLFTLIIMQYCGAQTTSGIDKLPVNIVTAANDTSKPLVLYITGDGGWNKFSKTLSNELAAKGLPVVALNARDYFWKKKTATQSASDVTLLIRTYLKTWNRKKLILIGYSFGADVMPFVFNNLPADLSARVLNINLLSPSAFTDFEIHITVLLGGDFSGGENVVSAVNKITAKPLTMIFGKDENSFPINQLRIKNYVIRRLEGGHHYDGDEATLCNTIMLYIPAN